MTTTILSNFRKGYRLIAFFIFALQGWSHFSNAQEKTSPEYRPLCTAGFSFEKEQVVCPEGSNCIIADHTLATFKADYPSYKDYVWDFGDGQTGKGNTITHQYFKPGEYKVTLSIYSPYVPYGDGPSLQVECKNSETKIIHVETPYTTPVCRSLFNVYPGPGNEFKFHDISESEGHKSFWNFGDGNSAEGNIVKHSFAKAGEYNVSLTIVKYNESGVGICKDISLQTVKVGIKDEPVNNCLANLQITVDGFTVKPHDVYAFNKILLSNIQNYYFWSFGDGKSAVETFPTHLYSKAGKYLITLTKVSMSTVNDHLSTSCTDALTVGDLTVKIPCYRKEVCREIYTQWIEVKDSSADTLVYTACKITPSVQAKGNVISYLDGRLHTLELTSRVDVNYWSFGDGTTSTEWAGTHEYKRPGKYLVTLNTASFTHSKEDAMLCYGFYYDTILHANIPCYQKELCRASFQMWVEIKSDSMPITRCAADIKISQEGAVIKGYDAIVTTADYRPEILTHYYWNFGDGHDTTGNVVKHKYSVNGKYMISVTKVVFDQTELLRPREAGSLACDYFVIDTTIKYGINNCLKELCRETYTFWVDMRDSIVTFPWGKCDASFTPSLQTPYTVAFHDEASWFCGTPDICIDLPVPSRGILPGGCVVNFHFTTDYNWTFGDGANAVSNSKFASHTYKPGRYLVTLVVKTYKYLDSNIRHVSIQTNQPICQDSSKVWITVNEDGTLVVGEGKEIVTNIFPNPLNENGSIGIENADRPIDFHIYDLSGSLVKKFEGLNNGLSDFSTIDLPIGIYVYTISSNGKILKRDKFSVKR